MNNKNCFQGFLKLRIQPRALHNVTFYKAFLTLPSWGSPNLLRNWLSVLHSSPRWEATWLIWDFQSPETKQIIVLLRCVKMPLCILRKHSSRSRKFSVHKQYLPYIYCNHFQHNIHTLMQKAHRVQYSINTSRTYHPLDFWLAIQVHLAHSVSFHFQ